MFVKLEIIELKLQYNMEREIDPNQNRKRRKKILVLTELNSVSNMTINAGEKKVGDECKEGRKEGKKKGTQRRRERREREHGDGNDNF